MTTEISLDFESIAGRSTYFTSIENSLNKSHSSN